jgi:hypothetical protein
MFLGKIICIPDPVKAAERDEAFFTGQVPPPPPFPCLTDGLLRRDASGTVIAPAGLLSPHGTVERGAQRGRYDDVAGRGWMLVTQRPEVLAALDAEARATLAEMGAHTVLIGDAASADPAAWRDLDGKFGPWLQQHGVDTVLVRPDFYLYGANAAGAVASKVNALVSDWATDLQRHGVRLQAVAAVAA